MAGSKNKRFIVVLNDTTFATSSKVIKDTETGVCYLYHGDGYGGGLTPLLDKDGKPVITSGKG